MADAPFYASILDGATFPPLHYPTAKIRDNDNIDVGSRPKNSTVLGYFKYIIYLRFFSTSKEQILGAVHNLRLQIEVGGWSAKCKQM